MELTGCCFALDVPPAWRMETNDGVVIATSDESFAGFTPNVVLRESRLRRPEPTSPEAASQANLAVLSTQIPGSFFFHVEALPDANAAPGPAERRRLWAFLTTGPATATAFPGRNWTSSRIPFRRWPGRSLTCRRMPSRFSTT